MPMSRRLWLLANANRRRNWSSERLEICNRNPLKWQEQGTRRDGTTPPRVVVLKAQQEDGAWVKYQDEK